jgi:coenzyme PQQ synthesis protein D (PqqD)
MKSAGSATVRARPSGSVRRFDVDGGLLLLETSSHTLWAYNDSARHVWGLLEGGRSEREIAADLAECFGVADETAQRDVRAILQQWRSLGLIGSDDGEGRSPARAAEAQSTTAVGPEPSWAGIMTCTIRDRVFEFAIQSPERLPYFNVMFRHLETPGARADCRLEVRADGDRSILLANGHERLRTDDTGNLLGAVNQTILEHIHPEIDWLAMIHGGAVACGDAGYAVPAACGSGKTTLIAYLVAERGYNYLADDLIALAAPEGRIVPWPLPLSLKEGSWDFLSRWYRDIKDFPRYRTQRGEARQILPAPDAWRRTPVPMRGFIFPSYVAGAAPALTRLTPFQALERLLSDRIWLGYPISEPSVRRFLAWLEDKPAYLLVHGDVAEAARLLEDIT